MVDGLRRLAVAQEYCYCSYSLLHQVLGFWIRQLVYAAKIQLFSIMQKYFFLASVGLFAMHLVIIPVTLSMIYVIFADLTH